MATLVSYWNLDEGTGTTATDSVSAHNGTLTNGPTWAVPGRIGNAVTFDGTNDYINITTASGLGNLTTYTIAGWYKTTNTALQVIYAEGNTSTTPFFRIAVNRSGTNNVGIEHRSDASVLISLQVTKASATDGNWHHIAGVRTSVNTWIIYYDGLQAGTLTGGSPGTTTINKVAIGCYNSNTQSSFMTGSIDEVRLYSDVLSATEILALYNTGAPILKLLSDSSE